MVREVAAGRVGLVATEFVDAIFVVVPERVALVATCSQNKVECHL